MRRRNLKCCILATTLFLITISFIFSRGGPFSTSIARNRVQKRGFFESTSNVLRQKLPNWILYRRSGAPAGGYILVSEYADQMVGASYSVLGIQCWAGAVSDRIRVVEPFVFTESGLGYTFNSGDEIYHGHRNLTSNNNLKLSDLFDLNHWQQKMQVYSDGHFYSPMVEWDLFVKRAPKNLIVISSYCDISEPEECDNFYEAMVSFADKFNFKIVRSIQIQKRVYTFKQFKKHIYGSWNPSEVVVFFQKWRGIVSDDLNNRYAVTGINRCHKNNNPNFLFKNSGTLNRDSEKYAARYLPEHGKRYVSVMVRMERIGLGNFRGVKSEKSKLSFFKKCLKGIDREIQKIKRVYMTNGIYLALDSCKHRPLIFRNNTAPGFIKSVLDGMINQLFDVLQKHGNQMDFQEWEASFDRIASLEVPGYVAQLQRDIASNGKCLLMAGGGSFQNSTDNLYRSKHKGSKNICSSFVEECF